MVGIFIFIFGMLFGSFANVVIYRQEKGKSFVFGRSACPQCGQMIAWYDNIPLLSFVLLGGRCRHCQKPISRQYPAVELACGVIFFWLFYRFGLTPHFFALAVFSLFLLLIFIYDLKHMQILDRFSLPAMAAALVINLWLGFGFFDLVLAALIGAGFFAAQYFVSRGKWVGDGDIRLGALMGLMLGVKYLLLALFLAYIIGAVFAVIVLSAKKFEMSSAVAFGPFLALATFATFLYGQEILTWYLNLLYL